MARLCGEGVSLASSPSLETVLMRRLRAEGAEGADTAVSSRCCLSAAFSFLCSSRSCIRCAATASSSPG